LAARDDDGVAGGSPAENARVAMTILAGEKGAARDIVVCNAACGFLVAGLANDFKEGAQMAMVAIDSGAAAQKFEALKKLSHEL
jgi:anthranilate phosphoribosyltransferase